MTGPDNRAASVIIMRNPLRPAERVSHAAKPGGLFIDWLAAHYPDGFGRPVVILRNAEPVPLADADFVLEPGDVVAVLVNPGGPLPAIGPLIVTALITAAVSAAVTLALNVIFGKPSRPKSQDVPGPDPIYSISGAQNAARVGEPVPALYGRMVTTPDYASQPYTFFAGNNQYLDQILVIGWGDFDFHDLRIGETPVSALEGGGVEYWEFLPADHGAEMGPIEALTGVMENVVSSPEVADQELNGATAPGSGGDYVEFYSVAVFSAPSVITLETVPEDPGAFTSLQILGTERNNGIYTIASVVGSDINVTAGIENESPPGYATFRYFSDPAALGVGPFITCKPGRTGDRIMVDLVFPQGLYEIDDTTGDLLFLTVDLTVQFQEVDDAGAPIGGWSDFPISVTRNTNTPVRETHAIDVDPGRYRVRMFRGTPPPSSARQVSGVVWTGLKFRLMPSPAPVYGNVSLLVVRIRATNGIAAAASTRISAEVTRRLPHLGEGPPLPSTSPADAFCDIYTNTDYGARRPLAELDLAELARLEEHWDGEAHFNAGFAQRSTVWEALKLSVQTAAAAPLPLGQLMSIAQDGVKAVRSQLFSDANMVKGTLSIGYNFDRPGDYDGVQVEYRDPDTWQAMFATWPPGALDADLVQLFGCTDAEQAEGFARMLWNKRIMQRKTASFETELEGLIPRLGDRVAIATQLPRWGKAGVVARVSGLTLRLDDAPDWSGSGHFVVLRGERGEPSEAIAVVPGPGPHDVVLAELPPFPLYGVGRQEPTHYAFASAETAVADFTIANVEHRGGARVGIDAIVYNPAVFTATLPWLEVPA